MKIAISSDLDQRYQNDEVKLLLNKATFLDPCMKSLTHISECPQQTVISALITEMVSSTQESIANVEEMSNECSQSAAKRCALESLLGKSFFQNSDVSVNVSMTELVTAEADTSHCLSYLSRRIL